MPANPSGGCTVETFRRFQIAWPASCRPPLRPTRGSGDGGRRFIAITSGTPTPGDDDDDVAPAHAAETTAAVSSSEERKRFDTRFIGRSCSANWPLHRASTAYDRSRWSDLRLHPSLT